MASFGDTLKRERELREITLREISDATKINIRYLEALEQNRFEALPGGLFNKGFIRAYSTYIGVDGEAMVTCYLQEIAARESRSPSMSHAEARGLHRPSEAPRRRAGPPQREEGGGNGGPLSITMAEPGGQGAEPPAQTPAPSGQATERSPGKSLPSPRVPFSSPPPDRSRTPSAPDPSRHAVLTGIDEAAPQPGSSRTLTGILGVVGAAAALFVLLSLILKHPEARAPLKPRPPTIAGSQEPTRAADVPATLVAAGAGSIATGPVAPAQAATHGAPAGGSPSGASMPSAAKVPPPVLEPSSASSSAPLSEAPPPPAWAAPSGSGTMHLIVQATQKTWVQLYCDSREEINWVMRAGDSEAFDCLGLIQINAADAAAVRLTVNDATCAPLGDAGSRVHGYTIRADNFRQICPPQGRGDSGRP